MVKNIQSILFLVCVAFLMIISSVQNGVQADVQVGSCTLGVQTTIRECIERCQSQGYKWGHCGFQRGSFLLTKCWCEQ